MSPDFVLGILYITAAFTMLWSNQRITTQAGFMTAMARWALLRRVVYLCMMLALFRIGIRCIDSEFTPSMNWIDALSLGIIAIGILIFPLLRALGLITQDTFAGANGPPGHAGSSHPPGPYIKS